MIGKLIPAGTGMRQYRDAYPVISKEWQAKQEAKLQEENESVIEEEVEEPIEE